MGSGSNRTISVTLDSPHHKELFAEYAKMKGIPSVSILTRMALYHFVKQRPVKKGTELFRALEQIVQ